MALMRDIREASVSSAVPLTQVLRMTKVLAVQLGHDRFRGWVEHELNGYPNDADLPAYRELSTESRGTFLGPFGSAYRNYPIPSIALEEQFRHIANTHRVRDSVSTLEAQIDGAESSAGALHAYWPPDFVALVGDELMQGHHLAEAWQMIPVASLVAIVETVRNRILDLVLELDPRAEPEGAPSPEQIPTDQVERVVHLYIFGGTNTVAAASSGFAQTQNFLQIRPGNEGDLHDALKASGLSESDLESLSEALQRDPPPDQEARFGGRVSEWLGRMTAKAASGAWQVSTAAAGQLLTKALLRYYGLE